MHVYLVTTTNYWVSLCLARVSIAMKKLTRIESLSISEVALDSLRQRPQSEASGDNLLNTTPQPSCSLLAPPQGSVLPSDIGRMGSWRGAQDVEVKRMWNKTGTSERREILMTMMLEI